MRDTVRIVVLGTNFTIFVGAVLFAGLVLVSIVGVVGVAAVDDGGWLAVQTCLVLRYGEGSTCLTFSSLKVAVNLPLSATNNKLCEIKLAVDFSCRPDYL